MKKTVLYIGLNDKDYKTQLFSIEEATNTTATILSKHVDGATVSQSKGIYTHDDGTQVIENTLRVELFQPLDGGIISAVKEIKIALNQESIGVEEVETVTQFI